jgi:hypothetical protein
VMRARDQEPPHPAVAASGAVLHQTPGDVVEAEARATVVRRRYIQQAGVAGPRRDGADPELANRAVPHGDPIVALVTHPDITKLLPGPEIFAQRGRTVSRRRSLRNQAPVHSVEGLAISGRRV